ncbi:hypothetical protein L195_g005721 [Trifolium pratense]|uniref:Uncharacterized protein n=1 Tax=Trifolium pratense TaxID=57577 RepID=A0A2K3P1J8_TRIPR|nr:hypothetical protein L195_g005721 [Trifolium pratense]
MKEKSWDRTTRLKVIGSVFGVLVHHRKRSTYIGEFSVVVFRKRVWNEVRLGTVVNPGIQRVATVQSLVFETCRDEEETIAGSVVQQYIGTVAEPNSLQWPHPSEGWWKCNMDASFYRISVAAPNSLQWQHPMCSDR